MRGQLEDTVKHKRAALEKHITPVPAIILDDIVCLGFDPKVKYNQCNTADPSAQR
jgi:hypothetical protein